MTAALASTAANLSGVLLPPGASAPPSANPGGSARGICSLSWQDQVFRFRTNPNEIWWSYHLNTKVTETYGGRVIQLLGTRLGDLKVKIDCGAGRWDYLTSVITYLRNLLSDQRNGNPAVFNYTTRNWMLKVYALSIPFQDDWQETVRELELNFKIQEDISGQISKATLDVELSRLQAGTYGPGQTVHNQYNTFGGVGVTQDPLAPGGPTYAASGITNTVDIHTAGNNPGGINPLAGVTGSLPLVSSIPGLSSLTGFLGG